jgi:hypothetical protein
VPWPGLTVALTHSHDGDRDHSLHAPDHSASDPNPASASADSAAPVADSASTSRLSHLASLASLLAHSAYSLPLPSPALLGLLLNTDTFQRAVLGGLAWSWLGDVFLIFAGSDTCFLAGLGSFFAGHVHYVVANLSRVDRPSVWRMLAPLSLAGDVAVLAFALSVTYWLFSKGNVKSAFMKGAVIAYITCITCML